MNKKILDIVVNYLSDFSELDNYKVISGDGYCMEQVCHASSDHKADNFILTAIFLLQICVLA